MPEVGLPGAQLVQRRRVFVSIMAGMVRCVLEQICGTDMVGAVASGQWMPDRCARLRDDGRDPLACLAAQVGMVLRLIGEGLTSWQAGEGCCLPGRR